MAYKVLSRPVNITFALAHYVPELMPLYTS